VRFTKDTISIQEAPKPFSSHQGNLVSVSMIGTLFELTTSAAYLADTNQGRYRATNEMSSAEDNRMQRKSSTSGSRGRSSSSKRRQQQAGSAPPIDTVAFSPNAFTLPPLAPLAPNTPSQAPLPAFPNVFTLPPLAPLAPNTPSQAPLPAFPPDVFTLPPLAPHSSPNEQEFNFTQTMLRDEGKHIHIHICMFLYISNI
jgi:hypothetical protein